MDERKFIKKCKELVRNYYNDRVESTDKNGKITTDDVFVIWFCKTFLLKCSKEARSNGSI